MPWSLEIHHIDVDQGDATLILIRQNGVLQKSVLIDGGRQKAGEIIEKYLHKQGIKGNKSLDIIVATHYDADHIGGLIYLLKDTKLCSKAVIYDRGEVNNVDQYGNYASQSADTNYTNYLQAVAVQPTRKRPTEDIYGKQNNPPPLKKGRADIGTAPLWMQNHNAWRKADALLGAELLQLADNTAPQMTCIAINGFIIGAGYKTDSKLNGERMENQRSLAFLIEFNNFRYYLGGDIESTQEKSVADYLKSAAPPKVPVHAIKVSHHGSDKSTSSAFLKAMQPLAAFISCGAISTFGGAHHPAESVIDNLQKQKSIQHYYLTACGYTTNHIADKGQQQADKSRVAGGAISKKQELGHIVLKIDQPNAVKNPPVFDVEYWDEYLRKKVTLSHP